MIGRLARLGVMGWLATKAYKQWTATSMATRMSASTSTPTPTLAADQLAKHMDVVGSDGAHVGTVDNLAIKLTKSDPTAGGKHHLIPWSQASAVRDGKLVLNVTAAAALASEKTLVE